jgi:hypothetical protein
MARRLAMEARLAEAVALPVTTIPHGLAVMLRLFVADVSRVSAPKDDIATLKHGVRHLVRTDPP